MRRLPNNALHKALLRFLKEKLTVSVYDYVPADAKLPFVTLGAINVEDKSTKADDLTHLSIQIHIWSNYKGRYEINSLAEKIINLLAESQLDLSADGFYVNAQGIDFYESYPEEDSGYSGVLTLEVLIQNLEGGNN